MIRLAVETYRQELCEVKLPLRALHRFNPTIGYYSTKYFSGRTRLAKPDMVVKEP